MVFKTKMVWMKFFIIVLFHFFFFPSLFFFPEEKMRCSEFLLSWGVFVLTELMLIVLSTSGRSASPYENCYQL